MNDLSTHLIHHPYNPPEGFEAVAPGVHKASTVIFPNVAGAAHPRLERQERLHLRPARHAHHLHAGRAHCHHRRRPVLRAGAQRPVGRDAGRHGFLAPGRRGADSRQRLRPQQVVCQRSSWRPGASRTASYDAHEPARSGAPRSAPDHAPGLAGSTGLHHAGVPRPSCAGGPCAAGQCRLAADNGPSSPRSTTPGARASPSTPSIWAWTSPCRRSPSTPAAAPMC